MVDRAVSGVCPTHNDTFVSLAQDRLGLRETCVGGCEIPPTGASTSAISAHANHL